MKLLLHGFLLALTYAALTELGSLADWLLGLAFGGLAAAIHAGGKAERRDFTLGRLVALPVLLFGAALEVTRGSWQMLQVLTGLQPWHAAGFLTIEEAAERPEGLALLALVQSASPGSVAAEIDREARTLTLSVIDASDLDERREEVVRYYRRYQKRAVP